MAGLTDNSSEDSGMISSINITPFVDVVLVLLVIFMITAPMLVKDILELRLPKTASGDGQATQTLGVAVNRDGNILLNGQISDDENLKKAAETALAQNPDSQAIIAADTEVPYGRVVRVIDILKTAGLNRFAVQIEREEAK
jgi:biopolymer transport protein ExbD